MGVRARWDQLGWKNKRLWIIGGDGAMLDIGFQSLSRMLASGMDIKVIVLDTQGYSNTGGQTPAAPPKGPPPNFTRPRPPPPRQQENHHHTPPHSHTHHPPP